MSRMTKHDYAEPGSYTRCREAAYALADADTEAEADKAFDRADARFRQAINGYARRQVERLSAWQAKGGRARWAGMTKEQRSEAARKAAKARWEGYEKLREAVADDASASKHACEEQGPKIVQSGGT